MVKELGIAKGSVYQYFEGKLDLFLYLVGECNQTKMKYIGEITRKSYPDFWAFFRALYECGYKFDSENPLQSHFLFNLIENLNSPSIKHLHNEMLSQTVKAFEEMVEYEISAALFREDIPVKVMGFMLYKVGVSIQEQLIFSKTIEPLKSIENNTSVFLNKKEELMKTVDDYIRLIKPSFDK